MRRRPSARQYGWMVLAALGVSSSAFQAYLALTKPAIIGMLLVTAVGGAFLAADGPPPLGVTLVVMGGGELTAGGANPLNHFLDRDIDIRMKRTRGRPIPSRRVSSVGALAFGALLNLVGFLVQIGRASC